MELIAGAVLILTTDEARRNDGDQDCIFVDYRNITKVYILRLYVCMSPILKMGSEEQG